MLIANDVWFGYDERTPVLRGVNFDVAAGAIVGILGPNGSGKTTLLRMLAGTRHPQRGSVTLDGQPLGTFSRAGLARRMAVVPQETQLAFDYTVAEVAMMGRYPHLGPFQIEGPADIAIVDEALASTGTLALKARPYATLSGGEKQRVVIAAALGQIFRLKAEATRTLQGPLQTTLQNGSRSFRLQAEETSSGFLLLDEPTASLDLGYQLEIAALLKELHQQRRVSIVISTHDLSLAGSLCARIALIRDGAIIADGPVDEALTPQHVREAYGVDADIVDHPSGYRMVVPLRRSRPRGDA
ncbi:MAG TPA: ABC transporter ATP-binding protein [Vicinamibacterales bacterium]|nr:ABC transporter ATP-binding protein [Vicinamibacterales bacterium]